MRSDSDIKRDVEEELRWEPNLDPTDIAVAVKNEVVTLTGFVRSYAHKFTAERAAKRVAGVVGLANDLEVRLPGADERPDPEIARDVVANLKISLPNSWDNIKAVVKNGWMTLEGEVKWNYQREYAERAVRWIKGVKGVSNLIRLQPRVAPAPEEIKEKIEEAFRRSALLDANRITVETHGSEVVLRGAIDGRTEACRSGPIDRQIVLFPGGVLVPPELFQDLTNCCALNARPVGKLTYRQPLVCETRNLSLGASLLVARQIDPLERHITAMEKVADRVAGGRPLRAVNLDRRLG